MVIVTTDLASPPPIATLLAFPTPAVVPQPAPGPTAPWRHRVRELGPPPTLPNHVLRVLARSDLTAGEWWHALGGPRCRWSYGELDYALRWLAIPLRPVQGAQS